MSQTHRPEMLKVVVPVEMDYGEPLTDLYRAYVKLAEWLPTGTDFDKTREALEKAENAVFRLRVYFNHANALNEQIKKGPGESVKPQLPHDTSV